MIIGVDIDETLTEVQNKINIAAYEYAKSLGKNLNTCGDLDESINNDAKFYIKKFKFSDKELEWFLRNIQEDITNKAEPRNGAVDAIKKLREEGHKIYIVTARSEKYHNDPYLLSKNWLDRNNVEYDKLIINAVNKSEICKKENIDLFIDDQLSNCIKISNKGVSCIRITEDKTKYDNIKNFNNWNDIYEFIRGIDISE